MQPYLKRVFEAFGRERCYWGTDMTGSFTKATYRQRVTHFTETIDLLRGGQGLGNETRDPGAAEVGLGAPSPSAGDTSGVPR